MKKEYNPNIINNIFQQKLEEIIKKHEIITSSKGKETYIIKKGETFNQIYVTPNNTKVKYVNFRKDVSPRYFLSELGTLLRLNDKNEIKLVENTDKSCKRRRYDIWFKSLKNIKRVADYVLIAIVYEAESSSYADIILKEYGVSAINKGLEVHHNERLVSNKIANLYICYESEHIFLHKTEPLDMINQITYLKEASNVFSKTKTNKLILTENLYDLKGNKINDERRKHSKIIEFNTIPPELYNIINEAINNQFMFIHLVDGVIIFDCIQKIGHQYNLEGNYLATYQQDVLQALFGWKFYRSELIHFGFLDN